MKKKLTSVLLFLAMSVGVVSAQTSKVTGKVVGEDGEPVIGASIIVKGTTNGNITDMDGKFTLENVPANATLVISYIGFTPQEIRVGNQTTFNITLQEDSEALDEVVVVGYGVMKKKDLTGAVSQLSSSSMKDLKVSHPTEAMAGKLAGVQVQQVGGQPGQAATIRVRGSGSITASSAPLYVVDGYPLGEQNLNAINPNDIESIEVLKDASAAAIYGSRAANGVVLVTTKSGKTGKVSVSLDIYAGFQNVTKKMDLMNAQEFVEFSREAFNNNYISKVPGASASDPLSMRPSGNRYRYPAIYDDAAYIASLGAGTDWQDEIFRTSPVQNYQLTVTGGDEKTKYMFSAGYFNQQGVVINSDYERFSARAKIDSELNSWLKLGVNLAPTYMNANKTTQGHWASDGVINAALATSPVVPVYNEDGTWASQSMYAVASDGLTGVPNAVALTHIHNYDTDLRLFSNGYIELSLLKNLKLKSTIGADIREYRGEYFRPATIPNNGNVAPLPSTERKATEKSTEVINWLNENTITYFESWGKHELDAVAGVTAQKNIYRYTEATGSDFPNDKIQTLNNATVKSSKSERKTWTLLSYLARVNYRYNNKYYLTASIRADGSSRFGKNNRYGYFPSGSVAWRLSQEDFLKDVKWLSDMKIRASYGITGNNNIGDYASIGIMENANYVLGTGTGNIVNGAAQKSFSNADLTWEKTTTYNAGLDFTALNGRFGFNVDGYYRKTTDLLSQVAVAAGTNLSDKILKNVGSLENYGVELAFNVKPIVTKDFVWDVTYNVGWNHNEITELEAGKSDWVETGSSVSRSNDTKVQANKVGEPINSFYVYQQVYDENGKPIEGLYVDRDANGIIDDGDRYCYKSPAPDVIMGLTTKFIYKNWDFSAAFHASIGNYVYYDFLNSKAILDQITQYGNINTTAEAFNLGFTGSSIKPNIQSDYFVRNASYLKCSNMTLGYSFPALFKAGAEKICSGRIYFTVQNPFIITKYKGIDPEVSSGMDKNPYPRPISFQLGLNLNF